MDDNARLQLQKMIKANNVEDQTELIRSLKHSLILRNDIELLIRLKNTYNDNQEELHNVSMNECNFLFTYYTDIYNKIRKDEINLDILFKFLDVLKQIEDGELDQHEGSFAVGKLLKEIYVDSALRKAEKLDKENKEPEKQMREPINIDWKKFKQLNK